jgi:hypothetical protein
MTDGLQAPRRKEAKASRLGIIIKESQRKRPHAIQHFRRIPPRPRHFCKPAHISLDFIVLLGCRRTRPMKQSSSTLFSSDVLVILLLSCPWVFRMISYLFIPISNVFPAAQFNTQSGIHVHFSSFY